MKKLKCAIYTRKSSEEGLDQDFNSLDAQREACEAFIQSQRHEGWALIRDRYDDGGFSGGNMERPGLQQLLDDIRAGTVDVVVVYKVDRLTRSLTDFAKMIECFDAHQVSFVAVTQQFNTTSSMGRLTLNVLLSFAQFEREVTGERIRDKIAASKAKGLWMGGRPPLGYDVFDRKLRVNDDEANTVRHIFRTYLKQRSVRQLQQSLANDGIVSKRRKSKTGESTGGQPLGRGALYRMLSNVLYIGKVAHRDKVYDGEHERLIDESLWNDVQALLTENRERTSKRLYAKSPAPLAGKLFTACGQSLTPSHTVKDGKRYRYYVLRHSQLTGGPTSTFSGPRYLPAAELERVVFDVLSSNGHITTHGRATDLAKSPVLSTSGGDSLLAKFALVRRVTIATNQLLIDVDAQPALTAKGAGANPANVTAQYAVDFSLKRRRGEIRIETQLEQRMGTPDAARTLAKAVVRAYQWNQALLNEPECNIATLARQHGLTEAYIRQLLPLASLSPHLLEKITSGERYSRQPILKLAPSLSRSWEKQIQQFDSC